jgi:molecular chaperone GrpE
MFKNNKAKNEDVKPQDIEVQGDTVVDEEEVQQAEQETAVEEEVSEEDKLRAQVAELNDKLAKEKDDYLRLMAEFDNYRRRTSEEKLNLIKTAGEETIKGMLTTLDECERAMEMLQNATDIEAAKEGTSLIYNKLLSYLESKGLTSIPAKGLDFDTDVHEAVTMFPVQDESQKGKVIDVMQNGYKLGEKVIRFAKVIVGQ